jgi:uncharacterized protein (UPF0264 family)
LVSVRDAEEAEAALAGGAALIDVKEPRRGALGAAAAETVEAVFDRVAGRAPVSAALGELLDWLDAPRKVSARLSYAKFGLAGAASLVDWSSLWRAALDQLPPRVAPVAVAYADWRAAAAPPPERVLDAALQAGCPALLIDTYDKQGGDLLARWPLEELGPFVAQARRRGLAVVLGGSLAAAGIASVLPLAPDYLAVRTAACVAGRLSPISPARVAELAALLRREEMENCRPCGPFT